MNIKEIDNIVESDSYLHGQLAALNILANSVRLDCSRHGWTYEASIIKTMQDGLRQCWIEKNKK